LAPDQDVGRAQIQFRAAGDGPWWAVDLRPEGHCRSALLPKPLATTREFHYFVNVVDRSFGEARQPDAAPDSSHRVRVVAKEGDCDRLRKMALMVGKAAAPIVLTIARNAAGVTLRSAQARAVEGTAPLSGFSSEDVVVA